MTAAASQAGRAQGELPLTVKVTGAQETLLFEELSARRDEGALRYILRGEKRLIGSLDELLLVRRRLENTVAVASAVSTPEHKRRARMLEKVVGRLAAAGVDAVQAGRQGVIISEIPAQPKMHPSKRRKIERRRKMKSDAMWEAGIADWEILRRGRAQGRELAKRTWASKAEKRSNDAGMVRGDKMFRRGLPDALPVGKLNDERVEWLRAGAEREDQQRTRATSKAAMQRIAREGTAEKIDVRIARLAGVVLAKHKRIRPSWVADEMVREDVRAGRYTASSPKAAYMRRRYSEAARKRIEPGTPPPVKPRETLSPKAQRAAARRTKHRVVPFAECEHSWRVSPKRTKRTCETCSAVERKRNGRWARVAAKTVVEVFDPVTRNPEYETYTMKPRTTRSAARKGRRWIETD